MQAFQFSCCKLAWLDRFQSFFSNWSQSGPGPAVMHILDFVRKLPGEKANIQLSLSNTISFNSASIKQLFVCGKAILSFLKVFFFFLYRRRPFSSPFQIDFPPSWQRNECLFSSRTKIYLCWICNLVDDLFIHLTHLDAYDLENMGQTSGFFFMEMTWEKFKWHLLFLSFPRCSWFSESIHRYYTVCNAFDSLVFALSQFVFPVQK